MRRPTHHLAQVNIARPLEPLDSARLADFVAALGPINALADYVYRSGHTAVMRRRRAWFHHMQIYLALWWVPVEHLLSVGEAEERLRHLEAHGPSPNAFTFQSPFPPPGSAAAIEVREKDTSPV